MATLPPAKTTESTVSIPDHKLYESPNSRSIQLGPWLITAATNPISNAPDCDALQATLGIPIPEMTFGGNSLKLVHNPSGWRYTFTTESALRAVKVGELGDGDGGVKVGYAEKWLRSRTDPSSEYPMPETVPTKSYDWTYTTTYPGHQLTEPPSPTGSVLSTDEGYEPPPPPVFPDIIEWTAPNPANPAHTIPIAELTRPDPILFYAEIPLFEDELHDNGSSALLVRIRVMPTCFFILSRFTLRVDGVLFRTFDTRIYHSFSSDPPLLIRETSGWEAPYDRVRRFLPKRNDLTPLTDPTWIAKILTDFPVSVSQGEGAKTGWRGLGTHYEVAILKDSTT
ncbi:TIP41-domain-containing protein [Macrolepiota fuliginosa MF-IS2]|uniref:TIP41-domain-containing protein n=1 Tax=Macrolepiota fuliginosa MF-IS2 TaxID=1400762 RepID=A0A9P5XHU4_9AGAR|nr:TIP41-domain-containing protein [Macrolepiota fuliginosa MF-IS2]